MNRTLPNKSKTTTTTTTTKQQQGIIQSSLSLSSLINSSSSSSSSVSLKQFLELIPLDVDLEKTRQLILKSRKLFSLPTNLSLLLRQVRKLDFSDNNICDISPIATMHQLTSINLSKNTRLTSIAPLHSLHLTVCVVAHCGLISLQGLEGSAATLKSLIANDNNIILHSPFDNITTEDKVKMNKKEEEEEMKIAIDNYKVLELLTVCETVILSRNPTLCKFHTPIQSLSSSNNDEQNNNKNKNNEEEDIKSNKKEINKSDTPHREADLAHPLSVFEKMLKLRKLSLTECELNSFPTHWFLPLVTELRLSHNKLQTLIPEGVIFRSVKILDVSHNFLTSPSTLRRCRYVKQLHINGNPFLTPEEEEEEEENNNNNNNNNKEGKGKTHEEVLYNVVRFLTRIMPNLEVVDSQSVTSILSNKIKETEEEENKEEEVEIKEENKEKEISISDEKEQNEEEEKEENKMRERVIINKKTTKIKKTKSTKPNTSLLEEKDVVVEPPPEVTVEVARAPIIRRERTNIISQQRKREIIVNGADVAKFVMKRRTETSGW